MISNLNLVNTRYFSEAAIGYKKNGNRYTKAPIGSKDWMEFWKEQKRRCKEGYEVGGVKITGKNYYFLNFTRMEVAVKKSASSKSGNAPMDFPKFLEVQYNWWWCKEIARRGIEQDEFERLGLIWRPKQLDGGHHVGCLKTRGCGFSYMEAADGTYNYNFIPDSKSFYFAADQKYLQGDGILSKCWNNLNWLNQQTDGYWKKNRQEKDTMWHKKSSVKVNGDIKGFCSQIFGAIIDDANKVRGNRGEKLSFEEGGSFKNLKAALAIARPLVEQGSIVRGEISVFGTGGEEGDNIEGLEDVFNEPEQFNMLSFDNIWEEDGVYSEIGFFVPSYVCTDGYISEDGLPDIEGAKQFWNQKRDIKKKSKDHKQLDKMIAESPFTPSEALKRVNNNVFVDAMYFVTEQIRNIENNKVVHANIKHGTIFKDNGNYAFLERTDARPLNKYPHKNDDDLNGCFTIYENPEINSFGRVPSFIYNVIVDPFAIDEADDKTSLGVAYVIKQTSVEFGLGDKIVASFIGRPAFVQKFYSNVLTLAEYYNATVQSEIAGGGQGLLDHFKTKGKLNLCEFEPDHILHGKELDKNQRNRKFFMKMSEDAKKTGLLHFAEWLCKERHIAVDNKPILNVHMIYDLGLLQEIAKFNMTKNADRISAMILGMYVFKEKEFVQNKPKKSNSDFFNRQLFGVKPKTLNGFSKISIDGVMD